MAVAINKAKWDAEGFLVIENLFDNQTLEYLRKTANRFLFGDLRDKCFRSDLSGESKNPGKEKITQVMCPSLLEPSMLDSEAYAKLGEIGKSLVGECAALDFDMIFNKLPLSNMETSWHQDAAYWPVLSDVRACSIWIALDDVDCENGCMRYVSGSHKSPTYKHDFAIEGGALQCSLRGDETITDGELLAGSAIAHHGHTLHSSYGNISQDRNRRALVLNFRPKAMIDYMRSLSYDHTGERKNSNK